MPRTFGNRLRGFDRRLWVLVAGWVISAVGFSMVFPFLAIYLREIRDFPSFHVALVFPAMGLAGVAGVLLSGQLVDWMGRRIIMIGAPAARGG